MNTQHTNIADAVEPVPESIVPPVRFHRKEVMLVAWLSACSPHHHAVCPVAPSSVQPPVLPKDLASIIPASLHRVVTHSVPQGLRASAAGVQLFKEEFRAAQRLRSTEGIFIPEVVRTTHPPEFAPHAVASNPAPSYVLPAGIQRPLSRKAMGPGHLSQYNPNQPRSPSRGGHKTVWGYVWTESAIREGFRGWQVHCFRARCTGTDSMTVSRLHITLDNFGNLVIHSCFWVV